MISQKEKLDEIRKNSLKKYKIGSENTYTVFLNKSLEKFRVHFLKEFKRKYFIIYIETKLIIQNVN